MGLLIVSVVVSAVLGLFAYAEYSLPDALAVFALSMLIGFGVMVAGNIIYSEMDFNVLESRVEYASLVEYDGVYLVTLDDGTKKAFDKDVFLKTGEENTVEVRKGKSSPWFFVRARDQVIIYISPN